MKQENGTLSATTATSRLRASPKPRDSPRLEPVPSPNPQKPRPKSVPPDVKTTSTAKSKRTLLLSKPKSVEDVVGSQKGREIEEVKVVGRSRIRPVVEQLARPRRQKTVDPGGRKGEEEKRKELEEKLELSEKTVKNLQSEVVDLKVELEKVKNVNAELEKQKKKLADDLAAAEAQIAAISIQKERSEEHQRSNFRDIQKLLANKLEYPKVKKEVTIEGNPVRTLPLGPGCPTSKGADTVKKIPGGIYLPPPPPPPPPPRRPPVKLAAAQQASGVVEFYHSLRKQEVKKDPLIVPGNRSKSAAISAHSSIVGEIQNRSAHLLAIKADIETKGDFINSLIQKVQAAAYSDIEDIQTFVDSLDCELSSLADERAVLKHFKWPEKKADAMREASVEYRELKLLESEILSYIDDTDIPCGVALKKLASLLDRSERGIQRLVKLRNSSLRSYQDFHIPTDWMLDSGIVRKIKQASMKLANLYMKRVRIELESMRNSDRESTQEALLLQGVRFAYRTHQFAGGLDSETLCAFEEIRQHVPGHLGGSRELLAGIPSK